MELWVTTYVAYIEQFIASYSHISCRIITFFSNTHHKYYRIECMVLAACDLVRILTSASNNALIEMSPYFYW